ncbi:hypothetical protein Q5752_000132 [Cryptotrichosporon argae]
MSTAPSAPATPPTPPSSPPPSPTTSAADLRALSPNGDQTPEFEWDSRTGVASIYKCEAGKSVHVLPDGNTGSGVTLTTWNFNEPPPDFSAIARTAAQLRTPPASPTLSATSTPPRSLSPAASSSGSSSYSGPRHAAATYRPADPSAPALANPNHSPRSYAPTVAHKPGAPRRLPSDVHTQYTGNEEGPSRWYDPAPERKWDKDWNYASWVSRGGKARELERQHRRDDFQAASEALSRFITNDNGFTDAMTKAWIAELLDDSYGANHPMLDRWVHQARAAEDIGRAGQMSYGPRTASTTGQAILRYINARYKLADPSKKQHVEGLLQTLDDKVTKAFSSQATVKSLQELVDDTVARDKRGTLSPKEPGETGYVEDWLEGATDDTSGKFDWLRRTSTTTRVSDTERKRRQSMLASFIETKAPMLDRRAFGDSIKSIAAQGPADASDTELQQLLTRTFADTSKYFQLKDLCASSDVPPDWWMDPAASAGLKQWFGSTPSMKTYGRASKWEKATAPPTADEAEKKTIKRRRKGQRDLLASAMSQEWHASVDDRQRAAMDIIDAADRRKGMTDAERNAFYEKTASKIAKDLEWRRKSADEREPGESFTNNLYSSKGSAKPAKRTTDPSFNLESWIAESTADPTTAAKRRDRHAVLREYLATNYPNDVFRKTQSRATSSTSEVDLNVMAADILDSHGTETHGNFMNSVFNHADSHVSSMGWKMVDGERKKQLEEVEKFLAAQRAQQEKASAAQKSDKSSKGGGKSGKSGGSRTSKTSSEGSSRSSGKSGSSRSSKGGRRDSRSSGSSRSGRSSR